MIGLGLIGGVFVRITTVTAPARERTLELKDVVVAEKARSMLCTSAYEWP
jgi:hypothetical protein